MLRTFSHEFTHFLEKENPNGYNALSELVLGAMEKRGISVGEMVKVQMEDDQNLTEEQAQREVVAEAMTDILPQSSFIQELAQKHQSVFQQLLKNLKAFVSRIRAHFQAMGSNPSAAAAAVQEQVDGAMRYVDGIVELFDKVAVQAVENYQASMNGQQNTTRVGGNVQMQIRQIGDTGKFYVQADRQVLTGDDAQQWEKQIENYINNEIRKGEDVAIPTSDGHILLLTGRSSYKLSDRQVSSIQNKIRGFLSDEDYARKGRAATHIDELIQVARFDKYNPDVNGKHENDIGEDGFNYYEAYFRDFDGKYYRITLSAGLNAQEETAYSIGRIRERNFPASRGSSSKTEALKSGKEVSSNTIIYTSAEKSQAEKTAIQMAFEKAFGNKQSQTEKSEETEQHQKRTGTLTNRDILAETNDAALQNDAEREVMKKFREKLEQSKEQNRKMEELGQQIARIQSEKTPQSQKKLRELKDEQIKTKNRIDILEAQIKRLEKSVSMDSILTREKDRILQSLWNEYGKLPKGENAVRNDTLPASIDGKNKVSRTARTVKGAAVTPDDFADRAFFPADGRIIRILLIYFIQ